MRSRAPPLQAAAALGTVVFALACVARPAPGPGPREVPQWIWSAAALEDGQRVWFFRGLELGEDPGTARIEGSCDNGMQVRLNGRLVLEGDDWTRPTVADVGGVLRTGRNAIAVVARNEGGPAGLQLALVWTGADGVERRLVTDGSWSATLAEPPGWDREGFRPRGLEPARELGPLGGGVWGALPEPVAAERAGALSGAQVEVAEGYVVELLYSVPRWLYGSWIALTFDGRGRALVSHERGGLYRLTLPDAPGGEVAIEVVDDTLGGAQGLLVRERDLYVVAHARDGRPPGLYRLTDTGGDRYGAPELLRPLDGSGEHGPHAVVAAGERLLLVAGNHTRLPEDVVRSRVPRTWSEDQLLPRRDDPGGHAVGVMAPGGWVASVDRDGGDLELIACGLRNTYDVAWGPGGDLFGYDSDMEWDAGLAWYRPPRVLHLAAGADFGWRHGSGKWPADWPDTLPGVVDTDLASPTGVLDGRTLRGFAGRDRAALLVADWAYGRILAVDLEPSGASWSGRVRHFLSGRPLPVTDLAAGPDGWLYFTTGGRGAQSGLYRVRWTGAPGSPEAADVTTPDPTGVPERRALARLEALRDEPGAGAVAFAWPWLASDDPTLRHAARLVLEGRPVELWLERARAETRPRAVAQAVVALAHAGDALLARTAAELALRQPLEQLAPAVAVDLLRALALVELRLGGIPAPERDALRARLEGVFPRGVGRLDRELLALLVRLESERALAAGVALLERAETSEQATGLAFALIEARRGWTDPLRARFLAWVAAAPARFAGGASFRGYLEALSDDARVRLGELPAALESTTAVTPRPVRRFVRAWRPEELARDLDRVRAGRSFERGRELFEVARCLDCHQVRGEGGRTGPDLTGAGARYRPEEVLESVLEPSRVISDQYQDTEILTRGDELLVGTVVSEDETELWLRRLAPDEYEVAVRRDEVARRRLHPLSRMPEGLLDVLEREEVLDLLAFVLAGGDPSDPRFR